MTLSFHELNRTPLYFFCSDHMEKRCCIDCCNNINDVEAHAQDNIRKISRYGRCKKFECQSCSSCAGHYQDEHGEDYDLMICEQCPRCICYKCVADANGGGDAGW